MKTARPYHHKPSPIDRDPELAAFILECSKTMVVREIRLACSEKFGAERTPSKSAIYRFQERAFGTVAADPAGSLVNPSTPASGR